MPAKNHEERLDRLEQIVGILAEDQQSLQKLVAELARETRRGFDQVAVQFQEIGRRMDETDEHIRETDKHMRETDKHMRETDERMRRTDERLEKLIIAMGEFIRRN